ncbi:MAG: hypothetical protein ACOX7I_03530 [Oscillospiraceae bacterium]
MRRYGFSGLLLFAIFIFSLFIVIKAYNVSLASGTPLSQLEIQIDAGGQSLSIKPWYNSDDGVYYVFLPSFASDEVTIIVPGSYRLYINGEKYINPLALGESGAVYDAQISPYMFSEIGKPSCRVYYHRIRQP